MTLAVDHLSFGYIRGEEIIHNLSYEFTVGQVTTISGPSGQGKSTLLYLLGLLLTPNRGEVIVDGSLTSSWRDGKRSRYRASRIGFVFQDAALDDTRTVLDNVLESAVYSKIPRRKARATAIELMDRFGVGLRSNHRPGEVSGGQAQRIALCRAFLGAPEIILADEPTGNLDAASSQMVVGALQEAAWFDGATVVIATHDQGIIDAGDKQLQL